MSKVTKKKSLKNKANKLTNTGDKNNTTKSEEIEPEIINIPSKKTSKIESLKKKRDELNEN